MKKALTIAGSDSSGGAGIQADIKTFAALGVFGTTVITCLTAQNTRTVSDILVTESGFFKNQLVTILEDIKPDVIKIGVLFDNTIINIVHEVLKEIGIPIILDPVLKSGTGMKLLKDEAFELFKRKIIPLSNVITPNLVEAQMLSEVTITNEKDMIESAFEIIKLGAKNVIVKGGHNATKNDQIVDILVKNNSSEVVKIYNKRFEIDEIHGTGCNFSSSLAAFISKGYDIDNAFYLANTFVKEAIINSDKVGEGVLVANPLLNFYENSEKFKIIDALQNSLDMLEGIEGFHLLIPETKTNFVYSLERPTKSTEVAGVLGRITNIGNKIRYPHVIRFGASLHVSNAVIAANKVNPAVRSAINIKNNLPILDICKNNFVCSSYSRKHEPEEIKNMEGHTISWGINDALKRRPDAEVVYHDGDIGKEPMIIIFGKNPREIIEKIKIVTSKINCN